MSVKPDTTQAKRDEYMNKTFRLMWQVLFIFGIPAAIAVLLGRWIDGEGERTVTIVLLVIAFVSSWAVIIKKYRALERERKELESHN